MNGPRRFVVLKPGLVASGEELAAFMRPKFAKWWPPDKYVFVDSIPRTSTGKFLKRDLRKRIAEAGELAGAG